MKVNKYTNKNNELKKCIEHIKFLGTLKKDARDYFEPTSKSVCKTAIILVKEFESHLPWITPTFRGTIQFEWETSKKYLEMEITTSDYISIMSVHDLEKFPIKTSYCTEKVSKLDLKRLNEYIDTFFKKE